MRHFCGIFTKGISSCERAHLPARSCDVPAASSQQLAVAHPIIQPIHATEDVAASLPTAAVVEDGGGGDANADGVAMAVEDAEHFVSVEHDGIHGAALPFLLA